MSAWETPGLRLAFVLAVGVAASATAVWIALKEPHVDFVFAPGVTLEGGGTVVTLEPNDLIGEPGEIVAYADLERFNSRQATIASIQARPSFVVEQDGQSAELTTRARHLSDLAPLFWIQLFVGFGSLVISGWIWALRSRDMATRFFALSGVGMIVSALPSAIYTTRVLAIPLPTFRILQELNAVGASIFGISMISLFLVYPARVPRWRVLIPGQAAFFALWSAACVLKRAPEDAGPNVIIVAEMLTLIVAIGGQFLATRRDPQARAALTWLGLSVIIGAGAFVVFNTIPLLLGLTPLNQGYAFVFFLVIYLGLAAGLTRYRLFEVGQWAFRLLFNAAGALALVLLDAVLMYAIGMDRVPALGISLIVIGFLYLPLRDLLWSFFARRMRLEPHELLDEALHVAFAPSSEQRTGRWESLLRKLFDPLEVVGAEGATDVEVLEDGLTMTMPPVASAPALKMRYPWSGRSLFTKQSVELARQLVALIERAESSRDAYDRGVVEERRRMAQDLHDDVGARLLNGLSIADDRLRPTLQGAISDIRSIVSGKAGERIELSRLLADLRFETSRRLEPAGIALDWPAEEDHPRVHLEYRAHKTIGSAVREAISNVIRHSGAKSVRVSIAVEGDRVEIRIDDDGKGFPRDALDGTGAGYGLGSLRRRLGDIDGTCRFENGSPGARVRLTVPIGLAKGTPE